MPRRRLGRRYLDEVYCTAVREAGSHGTWQPETWIWPGTTGQFRKGVFADEGFLDPGYWGYELRWTESPAQLIETAGADGAKAGGGGEIRDPLDALSAGGELSYRVEGANEVLLLTRPGIWWEIADVESLLEKIRGVLDEWPLSKTVICSVFETPCGVIGISSRSTGAFVVRAGVGGAPHIAVRARANVHGELAAQNSARRLFDLSPKGDAGKLGPQDPPEVRRHLTYTPMFSRGYRIAKRWWRLFGRKHLTTLRGQPVHGRIARFEPEDLLFDPRTAKKTIGDAKDIPVSELFEEVTPELLSEEVAAELRTEIRTEAGVGIHPQRLLDAGVESVDYVSVSRRYSSRLKAIRLEIAEAEEESAAAEESTTDMS